MVAGWSLSDWPQRVSERARGRLLVVTGAGISAESGIPTYRGAGGLWQSVPFEEMATERAFLADPDRIWGWYLERRRGVREAKPNPAHEAVARLCGLARECLVVTQNVDDLQERAGLPDESLVHVHGKILESRCLACGAVTAADPEDASRSCPTCRVGRLRPGVVWFDEELPVHEVARVESFLARGGCDLVLVVGTTAAFAYIVDWVERGAARGAPIVDVNPEDSSLLRTLAGRVLHVRQRAASALSELARVTD